MHIIIEVLRLKYGASLSHRQIAAACGVSRGVCGKFVSLDDAKGVGWPLAEGVDESTLEQWFYPTGEAPSQWVNPDWFEVHQQLTKAGRGARRSRDQDRSASNSE